ncbi:acyl-CoA dehydrogenase family protein [Actinomadura sp. SCN-SB]|uniref:acyl-CoA dehydrogenase family protein n=1 Tax=Actinomadura sp. SCN-SB TaxID=3373092 RepID=UPI00375287F1
MSYPAEVEEFRAEVREILVEELPSDWKGLGAIPTAEETEEFVRHWRTVLHRRGLLGVTWPVEYGGRGLSKLHQVVLVEELTRAGLPFGRQPMESTGLKMLGNTLLRYGTEEQKARYLPGLLSGEMIFCQGFSEPDAGSDLASVRTRARLEDGQWVIDGQKIWTSGALHCTHVFVLARTDPDAAKHRGLSFLLVPLDQPGVDIRPIRHMTGSDEFCEIFFTGAKTGADEVVGPVNGGWTVAKTLLTFERGEEAATNPILFRAEFERLTELARRTGAIKNPVFRQRIAAAFARVEVMRFIGYRILTDALEGKEVSAAASVSKLYWSEYHRGLTRLALDIEGLAGLIPAGKGPSRAQRADDPGSDPASANVWWQVSLNARAGTIYAGTSEVQRNIIAERVLGLPR